MCLALPVSVRGSSLYHAGQSANADLTLRYAAFRPSADSALWDLGAPNGDNSANAPQEDVFVDNIDVVKVVQIKEAQMDYAQFQVRTAEDAGNLVRKYLEGADREHVVALMLNTKHYINAIHTVSVGSLDASIVHPREVYKAAILSNASGIICAHNHPSSDTTPSNEDIQVTKRLVEAGKVLGIDCLDHLIVSDTDVYSLRGNGHIT